MDAIRKHFRFPMFNDEEGAKLATSSLKSEKTQENINTHLQRRPFMERKKVEMHNEPSVLDQPIQIDRHQSYDEPLTEKEEIAAINKQATTQYETAFKKKKATQQKEEKETKKAVTATNEKIATYQQIANRESTEEMTEETNEMLSVKKQLRHLREEREDIPFRRKKRRQ